MDDTSIFPEWAVYILNLRKRLGLSQAAFGSILHYSAMAVSRWETGKIEPSGRCYIQLGNLAGDPEGWLFWSRAGLKRSDLGQASPGEVPAVHKKSWPDFEIIRAGSGVYKGKRKAGAKPKLVAIPLLGAYAGAIGEGGSHITDFASSEIEEMIGAPASWCPNPGDTYCLRVKGESMSPLINPDDVLALDTSEIKPDHLNGTIVVAWHRELGLSLARLIVADGIQLLESENREFLPVHMEKDRKWQIIGKAIWWIHQAPTMT